MPSARYEILVPLKYNDGTKVEPGKVLQTKDELVSRFGGVTVDPYPAEGTWLGGGQTFEDLHVRFTVDVKDDNREAQKFFVELKAILKERFRQTDIWMTAYPIRII